jgi:hypothetical protein
MGDYLHWRLLDCSFDSICRDCLLTVGHSDNEAELAEQEKNHVCAIPWSRHNESPDDMF